MSFKKFNIRSRNDNEISSQTAETTAFGSETKAFQLKFETNCFKQKTIEELHERMVQLAPKLEELLTEEERKVNIQVTQRITRLSLEQRKVFVVRPRK